MNNKYLQEQICHIKDPDLTLKKFYDEAVAAEARRRMFQDIGVSSSSLDGNAGISVSKWETGNKKKSFPE